METEREEGETQGEAECGRERRERSRRFSVDVSASSIIPTVTVSATTRSLSPQTTITIMIIIYTRIGIIIIIIIIMLFTSGITSSPSPSNWNCYRHGFTRPLLSLSPSPLWFISAGRASPDRVVHNEPSARLRWFVAMPALSALSLCYVVDTRRLWCEKVELSYLAVSSLPRPSLVYMKHGNHGLA